MGPNVELSPAEAEKIHVFCNLQRGAQKRGYPSRRARDERLREAHADPEFREVVTATERNPDTRLIESVQSLDLVPTDYSAIRW